MINDYYDTGLNTSKFMWEMLSDILSENEEKLPTSLNEAIYKLRDGEATVVEKCLTSNTK